MDKLIVLREIIDQLRSSKLELESEYAAQKEEAKNAPGAMQSASDMSRYQANTMAEGIKREIEILSDAIRELCGALSGHGKLSSGSAKLIIVGQGDEKRGYLIVPDGAGGRKASVQGISISTVSPKSPIGQKLANVKVGDKIKIGPQDPESEVAEII